MDLPYLYSWPRIAARLLQDGCRWPALTELAAIDGPSDQDAVLEEKVARLAQQTRSGIGPALNIWDIAAGLIACIWKHGDYDAGDAIAHLDSLWSIARHSDMKPGLRPEGVNIIGEGVALWAGFAHVDVTAEAEQVLTRAVPLIPPDPFSAPVCHAVLDGFS
ncbi:hypothetical protein QP090_07750 [Actinomadura xylanilytica]|nr:hypothetical protein [Actinomadura xylanilytica]